MIVKKFITKSTRLAAAVALTCAFAAPAMAQNDKMAPIAIPAQPNAIVLNTGALAFSASGFFLKKSNMGYSASQ